MENPLDSLDNDTDPEVILVSPPKSPVFKVRFAFLLSYSSIRIMLHSN